MKLIHHLATTTNELPLSTPKFQTLHEDNDGKISHLGWAITADYDGQNERKSKHRYELLFTTEEAEEFFKWLEVMLPRFKGTDLSFIVSEEDDDE